jgi:ATP-dependent DNA helicase RecG
MKDPDKFFSGAKIDLIIHKNKVGKDYTEKIFTGLSYNKLGYVLQYIKTNL